MPSSYAGYKGQCIGRVLHFLYHYCGFNVAEHACVGDGKVEFYGEQIATYVWQGDVPVFRFESKLWNEAQALKQATAIKGSDP